MTLLPTITKHTWEKKKLSTTGDKLGSFDSVFIPEY